MISRTETNKYYKICIQDDFVMDKTRFWQVINKILIDRNEGQVKAVVMPTCGYCKDCKFWNRENIECENDITWLNKPKNIRFNISDLKTQHWFGCVRFESKLSV